MKKKTLFTKLILLLSIIHVVLESAPWWLPWEV